MFWCSRSCGPAVIYNEFPTLFKTHGHYDKVRGQINDVAHLQPLSNVPTKYQLPTLCSFRDNVRTNSKGQGQYSKKKVKSRSHHDVEHTQPPTNASSKYQLPTLYSCRDITPTIYYRSRSLWQGQMSNQVHTMTLHTYNSQLMSLTSNNFRHLTVSEIQPK